MNWTEAVDGYCERLGPGLFDEPLNAATNLAFIAVAVWLWPQCRGVARVLCAILFAIGTGSLLFHTFAQPWAGVLDVAPIALFILVYIFAATRDFLGQNKWVSAAAVLAFFPFAALTAPILGRIPGLESSAAYTPVPLLIAIYAGVLWRRDRDTARRLATGAGLLCVSIGFRALDMPMCGALPIGTHFLWHCLNAAMLGWMIAALPSCQIRRL
ncbi:hypothetical protein [Pseudoprimorskyibacter insulae]|uniref:Ceramidase n=1 Tax=Pseudoprimorskyibacter insulae TaxID=1695997 RepID=A0A2R8AR73_9RHOB|nr:hypothetical protein [Pseudoprimorskyibacter insulae]SPF78354.1 hypothetical protein PRI8871_00951 [Pseudoprimorskyibacter insulae]